jgi:hypothetical protein
VLLGLFGSSTGSSTKHSVSTPPRQTRNRITDGFDPAERATVHKIGKSGVPDVTNKNQRAANQIAAITI